MKRKTKISITAAMAILIFILPKKIEDYKLNPHFIKENCIVVAIPNNTNSYFISNGLPLGFDFEMIKEFAKSLNRKPIFVIENDMEERLKLLKNNIADIITYNKNIDSIAHIRKIIFSDAIDDVGHFFWIAKKDNSQLIKSVNSWLKNFKHQRNYILLTWRYNYRTEPFPPKKYISEYDDLIKKYSKKIGWDWRLVASLIYQESNFKSGLESKMGANGLMQIKPETAAHLGFSNVNDDEANIAAGTKLINVLEKEFAANPEMKKHDIEKFVLAAYNSGNEKIKQLQKFTEAQGLNPNIWEEIEYAVSKSKKNNLYKPQISDETSKFVREILSRYENYKNFFPENDAIQTE